jgi:hypothetical protein
MRQKAMSSNPADPVSTDPQWNGALSAFRRRTGARRSEGGGLQHGSLPANHASRRPPRRSVDQAADDLVFISAQAQHDFAEIEGAIAALRHAQPDLEAWSSRANDAVQAHQPRSVWLVVGAVWISTLLLMAIAAVAITSLLR